MHSSNAAPNAGAKDGSKMATHYDDYDEPTITFYCEECQHEFEAEGRLESTDDEGGLIFIPGPNSTSESVYCPNDIAYEFGELPVHMVSLGGDL